MKNIIIIWFVLCVLHAQAMNKKVIISADLATKDAAQNLYKVEKFFQENIQAQTLKKEYNLSIAMELLEPYVLVTIKPIKSIEIKNKIHYLLQAKFPKNFMVPNTKKIVQKQKNYPKKILKKDSLKTKPQKPFVEKPSIASSSEITEEAFFVRLQRFWHNLDSEWLGLIFLALAGFLLVYRSARQMSKIKSLQEEVSKYQTKIEGEMNSMGEKHA